MGDRLAGKVAVITGGASGIGAATATLFVAEGASVVLGDIQDEPGIEFAAQLGEAAIFRHCNVTREDDVAALVDAAVEHFGKIDVMFNNAGILGAVGPIETTPAAEWSASLDILINGVFYGMKHASRHMKQAGSGSIISMSSVAGVTGGLAPHAYTTSKHAVVGLTRSLAAEVGSWGMRANCIAPFSVATPMVAQAFHGDHTAMDTTLERLTEESPLKGRPGLAEDVANAALWLASDDSGYVSGLTLTVDAGFTTGSVAGPPLFEDYAPVVFEAGRVGLE